MPLNFNVTPFYDDFDAAKHFYRILYRPSTAVQARELTQQQSILQNQITFFANANYKHGAVVKPGQIAFDAKAAYVVLQPTVGINVPINLAQLLNQTIQGSVTGMTALVVDVEEANSTDPPTIYVKYLDSGTTGTYSNFGNGENLTFVGESTVLATTDTANACGLGASVQIAQGVYYIYGMFCQVESQYLVVNKYSNDVTARIGLSIVETVETPEGDSSLLDNAQGSPNYSAPGAYRYKVDLILSQKDIDDTSNDANFVELIRLVDSVKQTIVQKTEYSRIAEELAARTSDTNGDFAVRPFGIDIREHLDTSFITQDKVVAAANTAGQNPPTITLAQSASAVDNVYKNMTIYITNGPGSGQSKTIISYTGSSKIAVIDSDWAALKVPTNQSSYTVKDLSQVNRGIYPPTPFGNGDINKLAVGLESGRAYVDGYLIDTLVTNYVPMDKARTTGLSASSVVPAPIGSYLYVKNISNIPRPSSSAPKDFLTIAISNKKASGSFNAATDQIGTARVHSFQYFSGTSQSSTDAIFQMYVFNIKMNPGVDINTARSYYLTSDLNTNNNGNSLNAYGDICAVFSVANVNGTGFTAGTTITGPSGLGQEVVAYWDSLNNLLYTEPKTGNPAQIVGIGQISTSGGSTAQITSRSQIQDPQNSLLVYPLPQKVVSTVRGEGNVSNTNYYTRRTFEATSNSSGQYIFNVASSEQFSPFAPQDYMAVVVASTQATTVGKPINLTPIIQPASFGGNPPNTVLTFTIPSGPGSTVGDTIKLMGTVIKTHLAEKLKTLTQMSVSFATPTTTMSLGKADIYKLIQVVDSGNPAVAADESNPANIDITNRYSLDNGQRDYYYEVGSLTLRQGAPPPTGQIKIIFKYFAHSGTGDYFSVDSYTNQVSYANIPTYYASTGEFLNLRDCLDFRPRRNDSGTSFSGVGSAYCEPVRPNDIVRADFQYYLSRIDKIYVDEQGVFSVIKGTPALHPVVPNDPKDGMLLYTIVLNPYTLGTTDLKVIPKKSAVYTMDAIAKLEDRIANLEYYTSLNMLEQDTSNMSIVDSATGLDRYKSGFLVDNFKGFAVGNVFDNDFKCSMDTAAGTMRPMYVQNSVDLLLNRSTSTGFVQRGTCLLLPYTSKKLVQQPYATELMRVNPFAMFSWAGEVTMIPASDTWKDTTQRPDVHASDDSAFDNFNYSAYPMGTVWGDWQRAWVGVPRETALDISSSKAGTAPGATYGTEVAGTRTGTIMYQDANGIHPWQDGDTWDMALGVSAKVAVNQLITSTQQIGQSRTGTVTSVVPNVARVDVNNVVLNISYYPYMRSRRINVIAKHFKPLTRLYPFFDGVSVSAYCQPYSDPVLTPSLKQSSWTQQAITWGGNVSTAINQNTGKVTQTVVDPASTNTFYAGTLGDPIYTDGIGNATLFFTVPNDNTLKFRTGSRSFLLTSDVNNSDNAATEGNAPYVAQGVLETDQTSITSIIVPKVVHTEVSETKTITQTTQWQEGKIVQGWVDPLAESFLVDQPGGCFITKVDLYFASIDQNIPVTVQLRTMVNGYPGPQILPFAEKTLYPSSTAMSNFTNSYTTSGSANVATNVNSDGSTGIQVSQNASLPTSFIFDTPVYVQDKQEYCLVVMANSVQYTCFVGRMGENVIGSTATVSQQPYAGVLFMSQNGSTWTADQTADLKFVIWRASFDPNQTAVLNFNNADPDYQILGSLPFQTLNGSHVVRVWHENHGMPKGDNAASVVSISNVATGTYNGLTSAQLTGTFPIDNVDLHSYTITVSGSAAIGTGRVGPDGVIATQNKQYDSLTAVMSNMVLQNTSIQTSMKTISGKSVNNNIETSQQPYIVDAGFSPLTLATSTEFVSPRMIASSINEQTNLPLNTKSLTIQSVLSTSSENLTPMVDISRISVITVNSLIDDPSFSNSVILGMDAGYTVTSSSPHPVTFATQTMFTLAGVTGTSFAVNDTVTGAVSGATATVVSWNATYLTVSGVSGSKPFQAGEVLSGPTAIGTIKRIQRVDTITCPDSGLDFSGFKPGHMMTITGASGANTYATTAPVTITSVSGNVIQVDCHGTDFTPAASQSGVILTQYNKYVSEIAPTGCSSTARYITRAFTLQNTANSIHLSFTVNRPPGSYVDCYYRILAPYSTQNINNTIWTLLPLDTSIDASASTNPAEFKDYTYTADAIGDYNMIQIKTVMRGGNSSQVPTFQALRCVCLAT